MFFRFRHALGETKTIFVILRLLHCKQRTFRLCLSFINGSVVDTCLPSLTSRFTHALAMTCNMITLRQVLNHRVDDLDVPVPAEKLVRIYLQNLRQRDESIQQACALHRGAQPKGAWRLADYSGRCLP